MIFSVNFSKLCGNVILCKEALREWTWPWALLHGFSLCYFVGAGRSHLRRAGGRFIYRECGLRWELMSHHDPAIEAFYTTHAWRRCRKTFLNDRGGLCEICLKKGLIVPATQVHHKTHLTPENVSDPNVSLNFSNLMALCEACHAAQHRQKRWRVDAFGRVAL